MTRQATPDVVERAWARLMHELATLDEQRRFTPCREEDARLWTSNKAAERSDAAFLCNRCPVLDACGQYADAADENGNVWAGRDRTPTPWRKR